MHAAFPCPCNSLSWLWWLYFRFIYFYLYNILTGSKSKSIVKYIVYTAGTDKGSSGAPILKVDGQKILVVGLHRGGKPKNWDSKDTEGYNFGSCFSQIIESIDKDDGWHSQLQGD